MKTAVIGFLVLGTVACGFDSEPATREWTPEQIQSNYERCMDRAVTTEDRRICGIVRMSETQDPEW